MKKIFGKKMILTLVAGVLTTAIAVGGIMAWFTDTQVLQGGEFVLATVDLTLDNETNDVWNFYPGHDFTVAAQKELEAGVGNALPVADRNANLSAWWNKYRVPGFSSGFAFPATSADVEANKVNFLKDPTQVSGSLAINVTPGSFIYRNYNFKSESNIPVYLRVAKPTISNNTVTPPAYVTYLYTENRPAGDFVELVEGTDGYLYCLVPFVPNETTQVMLTAYLSGAGNGNEYQGTTITFGSNGAELIQATNNAVYMTGWADAVGTAVFVPYVQ